MKGSGKERRATPIALLESFFDRELTQDSLPRFREVDRDQWVDFSRSYQASMAEDLFPELVANATQHGVNLYLEHRLRDEWDSAVEHAFTPTPLLGRRPSPRAFETPLGNTSQLLDPLKKHLLMADSIVIPDNFFRTFDWVGDLSYSADPTMRPDIDRAIDGINDWLAILVDLRPLITSGALVFLPPALAPSFPYSGNSPVIKEYRAKLRMRPGKEQAHKLTHEEQLAFADRLREAGSLAALVKAEAEKARSYTGPQVETFNEEEVIGAWLNARILGLDAVFPTQAMTEYAARMYFDDGPEAGDVTSDLLTIGALPFADAQEMSVDDIVSMRKNDEVFNEVRRVVAGCKAYVESMPPTTDQRRLSIECKNYINDELERLDRPSKLRLIQHAAVPGMLFSIAVGVAFMSAAPIVGVLASAILTPRTLRAIEARLDPRRQALGRVYAML